MIKSREEKSSHRQTLWKTSTGSSALNSARVRYHLLHSTGGDHPMSSLEIRVPMPASRQHVHDGECHQSTAKVALWQGLHTVRATQTYQRFILNLWRKPRAVNGLLEARVFMPVDNPLMVRGSSYYHEYCYEGADISPKLRRVEKCPCRCHPGSVGGRST